MTNMRKDLGITPKTAIARELKALGYRLHKVRTMSDKHDWERLWQNYLKRYGQEIAALRRGKPVYQSGVRVPKEYAKAYAVVANVLEDGTLFTYLTNAHIPSNSNGIEALNGVLRELLRRHRGAPLATRKAMVAWALLFRQTSDNSELRRHWNRHKS
jgi:hypothetical protein